MRSLRPLVLAAALTAPALAHADVDSSRLVPAQMNLAGFLNVSKILADYGFLFDGGPLADRIDEFVAMGMPDPRLEDIAEVAIATTVEGIDEVPGFTAFVTRNHGDSPPALAHRFAAFVNSIGYGRIEQSAYRGVLLYGLREQDEKLRAKLADLCERRHMVSFDPQELHPFAELAVDTSKGQNDSFHDRFGAQLDQEHYLAVSLELTEELKRNLDDSALNFLTLMDQAKLGLAVQGEMIRLALDGTCADDFDAEALKRAFVRVFERLQERFADDPQWGPIFSSVVFERVDNLTTVSIELPEEMVREFLEDLTGNLSFL